MNDTDSPGEVDRRAVGVVEAVVFDFGGVFIGSPFVALSAAIVGKGVDSHAGLQQVFGDYHQDGDHPWHRLERGELAFLDARDEIIQTSRDAVGVELDIIELFSSYGGDSEVRADMVDLARAVGASGRTVAMLTNNLAEFSEGWRSMLPVDELFSDVIDSSRVGLRKPDPAIYELTQQRLGIADPATILFLDDVDGNVEAARSVGWQALLVEEDHARQVSQVRAQLQL